MRFRPDTRHIWRIIGVLLVLFPQILFAAHESCRAAKARSIIFISVYFKFHNSISVTSGFISPTGGFSSYQV